MGEGLKLTTHWSLGKNPFLTFNSLNVEGGCNSRLKLSFPLPPCTGGLAPHFGCSICCLGPPPKPRLKCFQHPVARVLQIYYLISCFSHLCSCRWSLDYECHLLEGMFLPEPRDPDQTKCSWWLGFSRSQFTGVHQMNKKLQVKLSHFFPSSSHYCEREISRYVKW